MLELVAFYLTYYKSNGPLLLGLTVALTLIYWAVANFNLIRGIYHCTSLKNVLTGNIGKCYSLRRGATCEKTDVGYVYGWCNDDHNYGALPGHEGGPYGDYCNHWTYKSSDNCPPSTCKEISKQQPQKWGWCADPGRERAMLGAPCGPIDGTCDNWIWDVKKCASCPNQPEPQPDTDDQQCDTEVKWNKKYSKKWPNCYNHPKLGCTRESLETMKKKCADDPVCDGFSISTNGKAGCYKTNCHPDDVTGYGHGDYDYYEKDKKKSCNRCICDGPAKPKDQWKPYLNRNIKIENSKNANSRIKGVVRLEPMPRETGKYTMLNDRNCVLAWKDQRTVGRTIDGKRITGDPNLKSAYFSCADLNSGIALTLDGTPDSFKINAIDKSDGTDLTMSLPLDGPCSTVNFSKTKPGDLLAAHQLS